MYELWPPDSYPTIDSVEPAVVGATLDAYSAGLSNLTAETPAVAAATTREIRPIFVKGQGGVLRWSVTVTPLAGIGMDVQAQVIFVDDDDTQVDRWTGPEWTVDAPIVLSARLDVPRTATKAQLKVLSTSDTDGGQWTETDSRLEQIPAADPYVPPPVDDTFADVSPEGVAPPAPPAGLPGFEANSPARRSPQVRWCQLNDSIRPDLTPKKNAREV